MKKCIGLAILMAITFSPAMILAWPVPDTGQTKCYDYTKEIPCPQPGEAFYGQDGSYINNPMSYTKLDADGNALPDEAETWVMVRDNVTSLIWEGKQNKDNVKNYANPHDADNTYTWYDSNPETNGGDPGTPGDGMDTATEDFIADLNGANYGGHDDWRMPTINELVSLVNYSIPWPGPRINTSFFPYTAASSYWSSTTYARFTSQAWVEHFGNDPYGTFAKYGSNYVRAVRGGQSGSLDHLVINVDGTGTVTDTETGLMWQQDTPDNLMTWEWALLYCETSNLADYTDWRLPTIKELQSLVDYSRYNLAIDPAYFPDTTAATSYWSSTTYAGNTPYAWQVFFAEGYEGGFNKYAQEYVRAVRGGKSGPLGHFVILSPKQASSWNIGNLMPIRWNTARLGASVKISLSRQGGLDNTFETLIASTPNDGQQDWTITKSASVNCVIKIEQAGNPLNWATEGLFVIEEAVNPEDVDNDEDGYTENQVDCNDSNALIHPGAAEICGDGIDQDCNGSDLACVPGPNDTDNDGDGFTENQDDCNDNNATIHPGAIEICGDGVDQDCNGSDLACVPGPNDIDNDGDGFTENQGDCNDSDATIHPGANELCGDGKDNNCSGTVDEGCLQNQSPIAHAGTSQTVNSGDTVSLDASGSNDSDGTIASYLWTQTGGPTVALSQNNIIKPTFSAPAVSEAATLTFQLTVEDNEGLISTDTVDITVNKVSSGGGGGGCFISNILK